MEASTSVEPDSATQVAESGQATPGRRFPTGLVAVGIAIGLLLGFGAGLLAPIAMRPGENSVAAGFLRDMSTHHAQAVEMSMIAYQRASNADVRNLAGDMGLTQHGQIGMMQAWLRSWNLDPTGSEPPMAWMPGGAAAVRNGLMPGMATPEQLTKLRAATGKDLDILYLQLIRQHHLGGIHMAQEAVKRADNDDVTWLAQTMINGQQGEITLIGDLLTQLGAPS